MNTSRIPKKRGESENKAIEGGEIRGALARAIGDQQLVLEEQRLGGDGACTTSAHEFGDGDDKVNREDEEVAHGANASTASIESKTAQHAPLALNSSITISPPTGGKVVSTGICAGFLD